MVDKQTTFLHNQQMQRLKRSYNATRVNQNRLKNVWQKNGHPIN